MPAPQALDPRLPAPDPDAAAHGERMLAHLRRRIEAAGGALTFEQYMHEALYAPGLGYYSAGAAKLGAAGDFVTAPELGPLFAGCIGRHAAALLERLGGGDVLELGAGTGALAAGVLETLAGLGALPRRYLILEPSPELRARQQARLGGLAPPLGGRVTWLEALPEGGIRGLILANEVADALPVARVRSRAGTLKELGVCWRNGPAGCELEPRPQVRTAWEGLLQTLPAALPADYETELSLALAPWIRGLADALAAGEVLLVDYGHPAREYYHPRRTGGTLMCHYRHRAHPDPFLLPGLQDITAHVDFSAAARAGAAAGLRLAGFTTQAEFLLGNGLLEALEALGPDAGADYLARAQEAKRLLMPGEMGERFKALALTRGLDRPPPGFARLDLRGRL